MCTTRVIFTVLACGIAAEAAIAAPEPVEASRPSNWQFRRSPLEAKKPLLPVAVLVERLSSDKFAERATAMRDLARSGAAAVPALYDAALSDDDEVSIRGLSALESLWYRAIEAQDQKAAQAAMLALDRLSASEEPVLRSRVEAALAPHESLLQSYALDEVRRLGATVQISQGMQNVNDDGTLSPRVEYAIVGLEWTGGEEGLRHFRRIKPNVVYFIKGANLPDGARQRFEAATGIKGEPRGVAYLGVQNNPAIALGDGVLVGGVQPNTPASKAGIQPNDKIVRFGDEDVKTFQQLITAIEKTKPGQTVDAVVLRDGRQVRLSVTMEKWK